MDDPSLLYQQQDAHVRASQAVSIADSLPGMMYGFGDDENPLPETVACMQELVGEYVQFVTDEACKAAEVKGKLDTECFVFAIRNDKAKFKRAKELLDANVHIKNCTRLRFVDDNLFAVFHPSFVPHPKVRAVVALPRLAATVAVQSSPPQRTSSPSSVASPPAPPLPSTSAVAAADAHNNVR